MNKSDADKAQFVHSPWLTPVEPGGIKPVIFRATVLYLTPRYFFNLRALVTKSVVYRAKGIGVSYLQGYLSIKDATLDFEDEAACMA
jgi:hypothetical protein